MYAQVGACVCVYTETHTYPIASFPGFPSSDGELERKPGNEATYPVCVCVCALDHTYPTGKMKIFDQLLKCMIVHVIQTSVGEELEFAEKFEARKRNGARL